MIMGEGASQRPVIIITKKKGGHEHHGGAWKVAFADFMTAMFALFLVLWILSQSQEVKAAIATYFRQPSDREGTPDAMNPGQEGINSNPTKAAVDAIAEDVEGGKGGGGRNSALGDTPLSLQGTPDAAISASAGGRPSVKQPEKHAEDEVATFLEIVDDLWKKMKKDPAFQQYQYNLALEAIEEGLVIQIIAQPNFPLFEAGTTTFTPAIKKLIASLSNRISGMPNKIEITGHGVEAPPRYDQTSKWLASAAMAEVTRAELEIAGYPVAQISKVAGCGDSRPLMKGPKPNSPENVLNQRISILLHTRQWKPERF
jgi:chemotaxis protein MotB